MMCKTKPSRRAAEFQKPKLCATGSAYTVTGVTKTFISVTTPAETVEATSTVFETAAPSAAGRLAGPILAGGAKTLAAALTFQSAYDALVYTGAMVACGEEGGLDLIPSFYSLSWNGN
jgi:hypothetical protein